MLDKPFYVYILTNELKTVLYTGVTNNLQQRIIEHYEQRGSQTSFTGKYNAHYLVYYEAHRYIRKAIERETEIKAWGRKKKRQLIAEMNPEFEFLNTELFGEWPPKEITSRL
jgi:putative endonuclease